MNATIGDVAARAGVSVATVSRALRGLPNVAGSTRERVLRAAAELDYVVNPNASRLAAGRNLTVASVWREVTGEPILPDGVLCAVNHTYCELEQVLGDNDEVAYFPPVTGG